ncbi:permease [Primorskyibacter sp. S187A]|uniref:permease n=1 Tax=Primorskyibacter sp. S187A TaxID=3415130 RepID=UPI003C7B3DA8
MADISTPVWRDPLAAIKSPVFWVIALPLVVALLDAPQFTAVITKAASSLAHTAPIIVFAVTLLAYLKAAGAEAMIARAFEGRQTQAIFTAALFGGLAPFCSCEVIPFIAGLLALGAPLPAVMAFWLSSPLIDPPTLLITAEALGWPFAVGKAVSAVALGLAGGFVLRGIMAMGAFSDPLRPRKATGCCGCGPSPFEAKPNWQPWTEAPRRETFRREWIENALFLTKWLALAYVLEALLITYVPADMIARVVGGDGVMPVVIAALVGMPAYLNGYVAPPLLAGLVEQGMSSGAALSFMIAGSVSCIPAMAAVWSLVKTPVFAAYITLGISGAIVSGLIFGLMV